MRIMRKEKNRLRYGELLYTISELFEQRYGIIPRWWMNPIKYLYLKGKLKVYISGVRDYINQEVALYRKIRGTK